MKKTKLLLMTIASALVGGACVGATAFNSGSKIKTNGNNLRRRAIELEYGGPFSEELSIALNVDIKDEDFKPFGSPVSLAWAMYQYDTYSNVKEEDFTDAQKQEWANEIKKTGKLNVDFDSSIEDATGGKLPFVMSNKTNIVAYRILDLLDLTSENPYFADGLWFATLDPSIYSYSNQQGPSYYVVDYFEDSGSLCSIMDIFEYTDESVIGGREGLYFLMGSDNEGVNPLIVNMFDEAIKFEIQDDHSNSGMYFSEFINPHAKIQAYTISSLEYSNLLLDGQEKDIYLNVDNNTPQADVVSQVSAIDVFGKEVNVVVESSTYVTGSIGDYTIVLKATDDYGVVAHATLKVHVLDLTKPVIRQTSAVRIPYGGTISETQMLSHFTITDNVSVKSKVFTLPSGFKFDSALSYGTYPLSLTATDTSGNKTEFQFSVEVYDDVAPVISKKSGNTSDPIVVGYSETLHYDIDTIINLFKAEDEIDGQCHVYLKSGKLSMNLGSQTLVLGAKDTKQNEGVLSITITIRQDVPPVFILSDKLVATSPSSPLDLSDLTKIVQNFMLRNVQATNLTIDASAYMANKDKEGTYAVNYSYVDENNVNVASSFDLLVTDDVPADGEVVEKKDNWFDVLCRNIRLFFRECGHFIERCVNVVRGKGWKTDAQVKDGVGVPTSTSSDELEPVEMIVA